MHLKWLIEQAKQVQELEYENEALHVACRTMDKSHELKDAKVLSALKSKSNYRKGRNKLQTQVVSLEQQNKRYREELEEISRIELPGIPLEKHINSLRKIADRALEGE